MDKEQRVEAAALEWLDKQYDVKLESVKKCNHEIAFFEAELGLKPFADSWRDNLTAATNMLGIYEGLKGVVRDRDEWREQHENLLAMYRTATAALEPAVAYIATLETENERLHEKASALATGILFCSGSCGGGLANKGINFAELQRLAALNEQVRHDR